MPMTAADIRLRTGALTGGPGGAGSQWVNGYGLRTAIAACAVLALGLCLVRGALAAPPAGAQGEANRVQQEQLLREQQREQQFRRQAQPSVDVRLDDPAAKQEEALELPKKETPCFPIQDISLAGDLAGRFKFALTKAFERSGFKPGMCLGTRGVNVMMTLAQNAVIKRGYTTTRILAAAQDLKSGRLQLTVIPGRIQSIRFVDEDGKTQTGRVARHVNAFPSSPGDILNLRDIEQALENLRRVPTADADIEITPAETPNQSELVIRRVQQRAIPLRGTVSFDDGGYRGTGKHQANVTFFADSPLGLSDLFYVSYGHHVLRAPSSKGQDGTEANSGTQGWSAHYSVPFGNWLLAFNHSASRYHQATVVDQDDALGTTSVDYNGKNQLSDVGLTRLLYRDAKRKTFLGCKLWRRESRNYIGDQELGVQHRRTSGWEVNVDHKEFIGDAIVGLGLGYRHGTSARGGLPVSVEQGQGQGEGPGRPRIVSADATLFWPFAAGKQMFIYDGSLHAQRNKTPMVLQDAIFIGGRYTVRGFDGQMTFAGDRGVIWRNSLGWQYLPDHQVYLGADMGRVSGPLTRTQPGRLLAGAVAGLKGQFRSAGQVYYDVFVGGPVHKPSGFQTSSVVAGFTLSYSF